MKKKILICGIAIVLVTIRESAAKVNSHTINLAAELSEEPIQLAKEDDHAWLNLTIDNLLPGRKYNFDFEYVARDVETVELPVRSAKSKVAAAGLDDPARKLLIERLKEVQNLANESDLPSAIDALRRAKKEADEVKDEKLMAEVERALKGTTRKFGPILLPVGSALKVTIKRLKKDSQEEEKKWTVTFEVAGGGRSFPVFYGFGAFRNKDKEFFMEEDPDSNGVFLLREKEDRREYDFEVMFIWIQPLFDVKTISVGVNLGLGTNFEDTPTTLIGLSALLGQQMGVTVGGGFRSAKVLKGRFRNEDIDKRQFKEVLDSEDLLEDAYRWTWYVSLVFRFTSNPFK